MEPVRFGKYSLLDRISVGGMAEVFRAQTANDKIVAIKRILPTVCEDQNFIKMFVQEARIGGQLFHPNICETYELGRNDGAHFIAMEYIWGKDLLQIVNRVRKLKQRIPIVMICAMVTRMLDGLDYAHRKRDPVGRSLELVHRDCSPNNVLVSYEGDVKVIDFGIAKARSRIAQSTVGVLKGKFAYMSPEQVNGKKIDRRSDIFALGTILYECATRERLFTGETDFSILEKVRNVDIRPPHELWPAIPDGLEKVILKALAREVEDRYQWCSEMRADLETFGNASTEQISDWMKELFAKDIVAEREKFSGTPTAAPVETLDLAADFGSDTQLDAPAFPDLDEGLLTFEDPMPAPKRRR